MKVLQLGKFYPIRGGVEKVMRDLAEGICSQGIDCDMLCAMLPSSRVDPKDRGKESAQDGATIIRLGSEGRIIAVKALAKKAGTMISPAMISWLRAHKDEYDIIHVHCPDPMAVLALRLSRFKGKVIVHWHSDILSQKVLFFFFKPLQDWLLRRASVIIGTTPVYLQESPWLKGVQSKCVCVPIGVDPLPVDERESAHLKRAFSCRYLILSVGRLVPYKGFVHLVRAMSHLPSEYELFLVGDGPMRAELEEEIGKLGLEERVTLAGYVEEGNEFLDLFGACDVFVLPSVLRTEAFGIVQIEAMSCGKPVVATKIPGSGVSWVNKDGCSGLNVEPGDPVGLAEAIKAVCARKDEYGKGALALYRERYRREDMINKIIAIYDRQNS